MKKVLGVVAGYAVWTVLFLGGSAALRSAFGVSEIESFVANPSIPLLVLLLLLSFATSFVAGAVTARIAGVGAPVLILGGLLLATGIPVQIASWNLLPVWYHLVFLVMLVPMTVVGGRR
jgi:hypothetical protein